MTIRIFERKGVQYFILALKGISHDYEVNIVDDGSYLDACKNLAEKLNVNVTFHGFVENASRAMKDLFEEASIFCLYV